MKIPALLIAALAATLCHAETPRSQAQVNAFKKTHPPPCPAKVHTKRTCPGFVVDHVKPLACGGADHPSNMQWQTVAEAKAKDKWERKGCEKPRTKERKQREMDHGNMPDSVPGR